MAHVDFDATFPAVPLGVSAIRAEVGTVARRCGLDAQGLNDVALAVTEAASNAIVHGYRNGDGEIRVTAHIRDGELVIVVADRGVGMSPRTDSPGIGLGLPIIAKLARRLEVVSEGDGTEVRMAFPCPGSDGAG